MNKTGAFNANVDDDDDQKGFTFFFSEVFCHQGSSLNAPSCVGKNIYATIKGENYDIRFCCRHVKWNDDKEIRASPKHIFVVCMQT